MKKIIKKYNFIFLISFLAVGDQLSKYLIRHNDGFYICNPGISFGFLFPSWFFYFIVAVIFLLALLYLLEKIKFENFVLNKIGIVFILGGAVANLIDRYNYGCVIDFIDLNFFSVFNLADIFITIGAIIIIMKSFKSNS
ncbi:MAG: Signal peptidase II [uncultured bacterium]|nr:MAG: Signal peptidase II [uncultured bacterium]KKP68850.1 MAG: Lipoprotein signal peptidase [Candidatus Moranbacteria bacterium GW2011_GWE1_35_17]KKP69879.1 MAG: Lipoprotein signal peptidase [Candidatus Moranbacteria bacterium GW2011_GWE2_35_164]KKP80650.1 MAG: Lipoprotein signal peptidase [Candidatus Moranbacteria bacterium GW2011_GWF1_35_5]KKP84399.1 MAG: Lipoprotein signal peptidase [Candidatus Moranbacteria bacterium GW2011_GWF2_35_54]HBR79272.1 signal peptidase II [Candidatus Moranbact